LGGEWLLIGGGISLLGGSQIVTKGCAVCMCVSVCQPISLKHIRKAYSQLLDRCA